MFINRLRVFLHACIISFLLVLPIVIFDTAGLEYIAAAPRTDSAEALLSNSPITPDALYTPTEMVLLDGKWFIVDCWHNRVLWSYDRYLPIKNWRVLADDLAGPHSIAFDGEFYAVENTGNHAIHFYDFNNGSFTLKQRLSNIGTRPHRIYFDQSKRAFYVIGSWSQDMYKIVRGLNGFAVESVTQLPFLGKQYTRSFSVIDNSLFFVGEGNIYKTSFDDKYTLQAVYSVPAEFSSLNDIAYDGQRFIVTATPQAIGFATTLDDLASMKNVRQELGFIGTPYYITFYDDEIIIPEITQYSSIKTRYLSNIAVIKHVINDTGLHTAESEKIKLALPK